MDHQTIHTLENIMAQTVDPANPLSPGQLHDVMEMMLTDMHLRKVTGEFWVETCSAIMEVAKVAVEINVVGSLLKKLPDLTEKNKKTLETVLELSIKESHDLRKALVPKVNLLTSMPCPDVKLH